MACDVVHLSATVLLDSAVRHAVFVAVCEQPCQNLVNYKFVVHWSYSCLSAEMQLIFYKYTKNLRNNGRMRVKFDKWLVHILFLCYLTILLNLAEGAEYGGC